MTGPSASQRAGQDVCPAKVERGEKPADEAGLEHSAQR